MDVPLQCRCGALGGVAMGVTPKTNRLIVCMCDDCQAYARLLNRADVLDANGGTHIVPMYPAQLRITRGVEHLACLRLYPQGLFRFYAGCCRTPVANCKSAGLPYAGVVRQILDVDDAALGPVFARMQGRYGYGLLPPGTSQKVSPRSIFYTLRFAAYGTLTRRQRPSPFFDDDGQPRTVPVVKPRA
jgi:hypothetical protein